MHDEDLVFLPVFLEFVAGPGGEKNGVALFHLKAAASAVLRQLAWSDGQDGPLVGFLLGGVRQEDATGGLVLRRVAPDDDTSCTMPGIWERSSDFTGIT